MDRIVIGQITKPQALKGEMRVRPLTNDINRFLDVKTIFIKNKSYEVTNVSIRGEFVVIKIAGIDTIEDAEQFRMQDIEIDRANAVSLESGEFFVVDLINSTVIDETGNEYGKIASIDNYGGTDIFTVKGKSNFQFPYIVDVVVDIDVDNHKVTVDSKRLNEVRV